MTNTNGTLFIDTPENVTFGYDVAGIGSRFLAALADTALIILSQVIVFGSVLVLADQIWEESIFDQLSVWMLALAGILSFLLFWGYYIFFEIMWNGQSPGKRWVGLRVIRLDGTPVTASESVIRNLVRLIDFLPTAYGVGVITMFLNENSRRVGDFAAGTIVVHDRETKMLEDLSPVHHARLRTWVSLDDLPDNFPLERLTDHDLNIIEEFLSRRHELSNRGMLARHILSSILTQLEFPPEMIWMENADKILGAIYRALRVDSNSKTK